MPPVCVPGQASLGREHSLLPAVLGWEHLHLSLPSYRKIFNLCQVKFDCASDIITAGELKIDQSFGVHISTPRCARNLKLMALDLSGPQVVASPFSGSYIKNCDLQNSLNNVE
jgi:hypothetical protein